MPVICPWVYVESNSSVSLQGPFSGNITRYKLYKRPKLYILTIKLDC